MMHNTVRISIAIALLVLSACSQNMGDKAGVVAAPVVVEEPAALERANACGSTDMDDGIGGTGCPAID